MSKKLSKDEMKKIYSGINLRQYRDEKCYSQEYVSNQLGISQSTYQRIESGEIKISVERLVELAKVFDKPLDYLLVPDREQAKRGNTIIISEKEWYAMKDKLASQEKLIIELEKKIKV